MKFPITILILVMVNLFYSHTQFENFRTLNKEIEEHELTKQLQGLKKKIFKKYCYFKYNSPICDTFDIDNSKIAETINSYNYNEKSIMLGTIDDLKTREKYWPQEVKNYQEFILYEQKLKEFSDWQREIARKNGFITKNYMTTEGVLAATFSHSGYAHLVGNLVMLIIFGIYVEMLVGHLLTGLIFLFGSFAGLMLNLPFSESATVVGASAGVSAIVGTFFICFLKAKMKFSFVFLVYFKSIFLPVAYALPMLTILKDVSGFMGSGKVLNNTAHLAHLGGTAIGILCGLLFQKTSHLKWPFLFEEELMYFKRFRKESNIKNKVSYAKLIYFWNFQNLVVFLEVLKAIKNDKYNLNDKDKKLLSQWFNKILLINYKKDKNDKVIAILQYTPDPLYNGISFKNIQWQSILHLADECLSGGQLEEAKNLYLYLIDLKPKGMNLMAIEKTCENIKNTLNKEHQSAS